ncbi:protein kinase [Streptomyces sp. TG1A-8]|uniref:phthiocerol/phthiodiolone dimycocerosyl transferase family protein n=1 Tax=Streptomyces sp. TG1A-8 TaxID=3051385 RepID=UPI00265BA481|nr:protein kinase [Streptomyces sp. TG1A-8]MDO0924339.1 protein kinase [Streptomyces sp. TG1A-8]
MRRALCPVESLYVAQRSRAVLSTVVRGRLDTAALSAAFDAVTAAQPTLRTRIVPDGEGYALELLPDHERPRLITRIGGDEAYEEELNTPLPVGGPLSRAVLASTPDGDRHLLVLCVDHTVTDGHSAVTLQNAVWDRYRELVSGQAATAHAPQDDEVRWPVPVSTLLPPSDRGEIAKYLRQRVEEASRHDLELVAYDTPREPSGTSAGAPSYPGHIEVRRLTLDAERTAGLRRAARAAGVSVHGLVAAAVLTAARRRIGGTGARTLGCMSPVDLRSRLTPPVPASEMVAAVTIHNQTVEVAEDTDPLVLAREVAGRVRQFVGSGDLFRETRIMPEAARHPVLQRGTVIVTNMGVVPGPRLPEGLTLEDVRLVPGRENYFPQAGRSPVMACVVSFEGRLTIEFPHHTACFTPAFMRAFRDDVRAALLAFTGSAGTEPAAAAS